MPRNFSADRSGREGKGWAPFRHLSSHIFRAVFTALLWNADTHIHARACRVPYNVLVKRIHTAHIFGWQSSPVRQRMLVEPWKKFSFYFTRLTKLVINHFPCGEVASSPSPLLVNTDFPLTSSQPRFTKGGGFVVYFWDEIYFEVAPAGSISLTLIYRDGRFIRSLPWRVHHRVRALNCLEDESEDYSTREDFKRIEIELSDVVKGIIENNTLQFRRNFIYLNKKRLPLWNLQIYCNTSLCLLQC